MTVRTSARRQRVLIIGPSLRYLGGQAVQAQRLCDGLRTTDGVQIEYLAVDPMLPRPFHVLQRVPILRTLATSVAYAAQLFWKVPRFDVLHVFSASYLSFLIAPTPALIIGRLFGKRVLLNYHSGEADDHLTRWGWHAKPLLRLADLIVVPTEYLVEVFRRHGLEASAIANHIDLKSMVLRERGKVLPRFLSNRNFESHYNVGAVLSAFAHVQQQHPAAELVVAGNGSLRASLEAQSESLGLANVTFTGPVAPAAMPALYAAADVYVNASLIDNMPLSLLEAYGSGLPVVTSDAGGIPWIAEHGRTALVVPAGDVDALANAMLDCVRHSDSAQVRARCALDFVAQRFIWSAVRDKWLRAYGVEPGATSTAT